MLSDEMDGDGLGVFLDGSDEMLRFSHEGRDAGFDAFMIAYAGVGKGAVIMMNLNDNAGTARAIINVIAKKYRWSSGITAGPPAWRMAEIFNALLHPQTKRAAIGRVCVLGGLLTIGVSLTRRILRRRRKASGSGPERRGRNAGQGA
jgi:hypothetical protein